MKKFMDKDFLLSTEIAKELYHKYSSKTPIIDYHCHVSPKEIFEDKKFENITQVWLGGDHYKWRLMRSNGVDEYYITGQASDKEKFLKFAEVLPRAIGNPMYHWCHLELKNYFGYMGCLSSKTAEEVWNITSEKLKQSDMGVRGLIAKSNVKFIGTTDDPIDSLEWHKKIKEDKTFNTIVAPSFRPDKALNIEKTGWKEYIKSLEKVTQIIINNIEDLEKALTNRIEFFNQNGCKASDHGLDFMIFNLDKKETIDEILKKGLNSKDLTNEEIEKFKTHLLIYCAKEYERINWVMQIHYNCMRNPNSFMLNSIGVDTGFDCIGPNNGSQKLAKFLDELNKSGQLPKTILYSLDSNDNEFLDTLIGSFQWKGVKGKIQHGSAWWFNDNKKGMKDQMTSLAQLSILGNFVGMLTDSRSFLSYTRHEYFRRILCDLIGEWVENGEYPDDINVLGELVQDISYNNAKTYFELEE
ncbi:MAG: glucuronate isomerase [Clostridia bacterium]|nr:glucuronate isomerase [Clostridia bacterium]